MNILRLSIYMYIHIYTYYSVHVRIILTEGLSSTTDPNPLGKLSQCPLRHTYVLVHWHKGQSHLGACTCTVIALMVA